MTQPPPATRTSRPAPADVLPRGATVGRYVIISVLGKGGMGVVYAAYDSQLDRKVAIKVLRPDLAGGAEAEHIESRLLREAQAMARLSHPNVVAVHDVGVFERRVFLAMDFVEGTTLKEWLRAPRPLRERMAALRQAGRGLAAAHAAGLVHRDFKPDNVLVGNDGRVVVLDFGLARADGDSSPDVPLHRIPSELPEEPLTQSSDALSCPLTLTGSVLGTVGYMAPEQVFGEATSALTDQFSFGATLYLALYGEKAFPDPTLDGYLAQMQRPVPEPKRGRDVPPWLRRVVLRSLSPAPEERFPSMDALLAAMDNDPTAARKRAALGAAVVFAFFCFVAVFTYALRRRELVCVRDADELRGTWDDATRAAVAAVFDAAPKAASEEVRANGVRLQKRLDDFANRWIEMREDVCRATRVEKRQSEDVFRLRSDCLERERVEVRAVTSMLARGDEQAVKKAVEIAYGLPETSWCADVATLRASAGLPDDPAKRQKVIEVRAALADSDSKELAGRLREAEAEAREAVALARAIDHRPTTAEALVHEASALLTQGEYAAAVPLLREAVFTAGASGTDSLVVQAAGSLAYATGPKLQHSEEPRIWLETAEAALARMGGNEALSVDLMRREATVLDEVDWAPELAVPLLEKAIATARRVYGIHPKTAAVLYGMGVAYSYLGDPARALPYLEEANSMNTAIGGPSYSDLARTEYLLGTIRGELGQFDRAESLLQSAIIGFEQNGMDYWAAIAFQSLTWTYLVRGDVTRALETGGSSLALLEKAKRPSVLVPIVSVPAASAFILHGEPGAALPLCNAALLEQEKTKALDPAKAYWADALRCKGDALMALGRAEDAVPLLERSLLQKRRMFPADYARAEMSLARALRAVHRDPPRVVRLIKAAADEFGSFPFLSVEHRQALALLELVSK